MILVSIKVTKDRQALRRQFKPYLFVFLHEQSSFQHFLLLNNKYHIRIILVKADARSIFFIDIIPQKRYKVIRIGRAISIL